MHRGLLVVVVLLGCAAAARAQKLSDAEVKEGFVSLFNGKDFAGWRFDEGSALPEKLPANWKVEDGVIKLSGGGSPHLASQWDYEDFDARFEWRAVKDKYNSGFYVRSGRKVGANQINLAKGDEGHLMGGAKGGNPVAKLQKAPMEWNEWRVLAVGDKLSFWCNGELAWEVTGFGPKRGYLGLQAEGAAMEFRNLRIKEIGYEPLMDTKGAPLETAKTDYKDHVLRLEWKGEQGASGGLALRGGKTVVPLGDLADGSGGVGGKPTKKVDNPLGQWNYLEVRVAGNKATVWLNGTVVADGVELRGDALPETGGVVLRSEGAGLQFRNVRVREIKD